MLLQDAVGHQLILIRNAAEIDQCGRGVLLRRVIGISQISALFEISEINDREIVE